MNDERTIPSPGIGADVWILARGWWRQGRVVNLSGRRIWVSYLVPSTGQIQTAIERRGSDFVRPSGTPIPELAASNPQIRPWGWGR